MLIDDDKLTNFMNKILIDEENSSDYVIRKETVLHALKYLSNSGRSDSGLPFPDLILLDVDMPEVNGWDFMRHFEGIKDNLPKKPIIYMLTTFAAVQDPLEVSNTTDLDGLYGKPLTEEILNNILQKHFSFA